MAGERIELLSNGRSQNNRVRFYMLADFVPPNSLSHIKMGIGALYKLCAPPSLLTPNSSLLIVFKEQVLFLVPGPA